MVADSWGGGGYHCLQREWRGDQWSLTEFKGGTKENWRPMSKIDRIIRDVMEGSGQLYCDNQSTPTLHTSGGVENFHFPRCLILTETRSYVGRCINVAFRAL